MGWRPLAKGNQSEGWPKRGLAKVKTGHLSQQQTLVMRQQKTSGYSAGHVFANACMTTALILHSLEKPKRLRSEETCILGRAVPGKALRLGLNFGGSLHPSSQQRTMSIHDFALEECQVFQ